MVFGVWCVVFGVWCLVFGVWCLVCGVWCVVFGIWCLMFGVWCLDLAGDERNFLVGFRVSSFGCGVKKWVRGYLAGDEGDVVVGDAHRDRVRVCV